MLDSDLIPDLRLKGVKGWIFLKNPKQSRAFSLDLCIGRKLNCPTFDHRSLGGGGDAWNHIWKSLSVYLNERFNHGPRRWDIQISFRNRRQQPDTQIQMAAPPTPYKDSVMSEPDFLKLLRGPGIDSKGSIPPAYAARLAGTTTLFLIGS